MYHPELYPELAKKNGNIGALVIKGRNMQRFSSNKENITSSHINNDIHNNTNYNKESEFKIVEAEEVISRNNSNEQKNNEKFPKLFKFIKNAARNKSFFKDELATNFFEINSIRKEINHTGEIYFGVNNYKNRADVIDNFMNIMEDDKNDQKFEFNAHTKNIESEKFDLFAKYTPSYLVEKNRINYNSTEAPLLEDLLEDLKAENRISNVHDLSGIPSTENAYGKAVRNPKENIKKIKEYFKKLEKKNSHKVIKEYKQKEINKKAEGDKGKNNDGKKAKKVKNL